MHVDPSIAYTNPRSLLCLRKKVITHTNHMGRPVKAEGCVIEFTDVSVAEFGRQIKEDGGTLREKYVEKKKRREIAPMKRKKDAFLV